jgi:hypothetical protein
MSEKNTRYLFFPSFQWPWSAARVSGDVKDKKRPKATIYLKYKSDMTEDDLKVEIEQYGPGDIVGFDGGYITRKDPEPNVGVFEPNYFPSVEFAVPDFPWRYTAMGVDDGKIGGSLTPWLTLIVLAGEGDIEIEKIWNAENGLPGRIQVSISKLPDLTSSWRWAHVQVTDIQETDGGEFNGENFKKNIPDILNKTPERVVSRLLCPRRLNPRTKYHAFIVPTFELGRRSGIGDRSENSCDASILAWDKNSDDPIILPFYQDWEFTTSTTGDFEQLVRLLEGRNLQGIGKRPVDCSNPGFNIKSIEWIDKNRVRQQNILELEGALKSLDTEFTPWGKDAGQYGSPPLYQQNLASLLNSAREKTEVFPPLYGQWQANRNQVSPTADDWFDVLNLDPRHRIAAGFGAKVIQQNHEELLVSTWDQLGAIADANEKLRHAQLGVAVSGKMMQRLNYLTDEDFLKTTAPVFDKILFQDAGSKTGSRSPKTKRTIRDFLESGPIPRAAFEPTFHRIARKRGPIRTLQGRGAKKDKPGMLKRLYERNNPETAECPIRIAGIHPRISGAASLRDISESSGKVPRNEEKGSENYLQRLYKRLANLFPGKPGTNINLKNPTNITPVSTGLRQPEPATIQYFEENNIINAIGELKQQDFDRLMPDLKNNEDLFGLTCKILEALTPLSDTSRGRDTKIAQSPVIPANTYFLSLRESIIADLDPATTIKRRVESELKLDKNNKVPETLDSLIDSPKFPHPMYESLRAISQELVLPGIEKIPQNSVGVLVENRRFIESYMAGLNEFASRLFLWNEVPADLQDTYFQQFWKVEGLNIPQQEIINGSYNDIKPLEDWNDRKLGENGLDQRDNDQNLILIIRGELIRKYSNPSIYAIDGVEEGGKLVPALSNFLQDKTKAKKPSYPILNGEFPPDMVFVGFPFGETEARKKMFFVIEERVSHTRFGLDEIGTKENTGKNWDNLNWGNFKIEPNNYINNATPEGDDIPSDQSWGKSSASIAKIAFQKPIRMFILASKLLPAG